MTEKRIPPWKEGRTFGFTMGIVLGLLGGLLWKRAYNAADLDEASLAPLFAWAAWVLAIVFAVLAAVAPQVLAPVNKVWMAFGEGIGFVMSRLVLGLTYFVALVPIALVMRWRGFDPLKPGFDQECESYWELRDPKTFDEKRYEKQY